MRILNDEVYALRRAFLNRATEILLDERQTPEVLKQIECVLNRGDLPWGMSSDLREILARKGLQEIARKSDKLSMLAESLFLMGNRDVWLEADKAVLEAIIFAFEDVSEAGSDVLTTDGNDLLSLSALFEAMSFGQVVAGNYRVFIKRKDVESLVLTIRGAVAAAKLQSENIVAEARLALDRIGGDNNVSLFTMLANVDVTPEWSEAKQANLDGRILARALDHPSDAVAITAAQLLFAGVSGDEVPDAVKQVLGTGGATALRMISFISSEIWGDKAVYMILDRLDGELSAGCEYLFKSLPKLASNQTDDRVYKCLLRGIMAPLPEIAVGAAEGCTSLDLPQTYADELRKAFDHWKEHEPPYPVHRGVIPPSPRKHLLHALTKLKGFTFDELLHMCSDVRSDVRDVAVDALVVMAGSDKAALESILRSFESGKTPSMMLTKLMSLPGEILQGVKGKILSLLKSPNSTVRSDAVRAIGMPWMDREEAARLAKEMLCDEDHKVRNQATRTLRLISGI